MDKDSINKVYGVLGYPAKHSLSPVMHNAAFRALNIHAEYKIFEIKPEDLDRFLDSMDTNIFGLNVTIPYKEKILDFVTLDDAFSYLMHLGALNTIVKKDNVWKGFNTDIQGFSRHIKEVMDPAHKRVALLGAGGAARAVCYSLAESRPEELAIFDMDKPKSEQIVEIIRKLFPDICVSSVDSAEELNIKDKDLLINATPVGMKESDPCLIAEEWISKDLFVYDLIYNPAQTKLLAQAKKAGANTANGLKMLLYQGALSFEHFTGQSAPVEVMRQALNLRS
jgi:shikimate dehydrogenase